MSLMPRSRLISDSPRSPMVAETAMAAPKTSAAPPRPVERQGDDQQRRRSACRPATEPAMPSHDFFGLIDGRHRVLAEQHAGRVAADVAGDHGGDEGEHPGDAVVGHEQQDREAGQQRDVEGDQDAGGGVAQVAGRPVGEPPQHDGEHGDQEAGDQAGRARGSRRAPTIATAPTSSGHQRRPEAARAQGAGELDDADEHGGDERPPRNAGRQSSRERDDDRAQAEARRRSRRRGCGRPGRPAPAARSSAARRRGSLRPSAGRRSGGDRRRPAARRGAAGDGRAARHRRPVRRRAARGRSSVRRRRCRGRRRQPLGARAGGPERSAEERVMGGRPSEVRPRAARSPCSSSPRRCRARAAR